MFSAGPSFFYLIKVGIEKGFRKAVSFAFGIFLSDILLLALIYLGLQPLFENDMFKQIFSLVSGLLIFLFGLSMLMKKRTEGSNIAIELSDKPFYMYIAKGFGINALNPFTIALWVGILGSVSPENKSDFTLFISGLLGIIFLSDSAKAYLAKVIGKMLTEKAIFRLNKILGIAFSIIGIYFMYVFYQSFFDGHQIQIEVPNI